MHHAADFRDILTRRRKHDLLPYSSSSENDGEARTTRKALDLGSASGARRSMRMRPTVVRRSAMDEVDDVGERGDGLA